MTPCMHAALAVLRTRRSHVLALGAVVAMPAMGSNPTAAHAQSSTRPGTFSVRGEDVAAEYGEFQRRESANTTAE